MELLPLENTPKHTAHATAGAVSCSPELDGKAPLLETLHAVLGDWRTQAETAGSFMGDYRGWAGWLFGVSENVWLHAEP